MACLLAALFVAAPAAAAPQHVVSAFLCSDEYIFRLLPRDRIAALSFLSADRHPVVSTIADSVKGIPLVHASAEEVLARNPDAVVLYAGTEARLHTQLRDAGVRIIDVPWADSLADIRRVTLLLGHELGEDARAQALVTGMDRALKAARAGGPRPRALIYEPNGYATANGITDEILQAAGLADAAREIGPTRSGTIPIEAIIARPPDLLLLNGADDRHPTLADLVLQHPALATLSPRTLVAHVSLTPLLCPGPWSAELVASLAAWGEKARTLARARGGP